MDIRVVRGDITDLDVEAVVNAANAALARGSGVCGAIFAAAGPALDDACAALGGCPTGEVRVTPGFRARARWIVHAGGPVWMGGDRGEADLLAGCYRRALEAAEERGVRSIAFPAVSTGIYGYPADEAAAIAVSSVRAHGPRATSLEEVLLVAFDDATDARYRDLLSRPDGP